MRTRRAALAGAFGLTALASIAAAPAGPAAAATEHGARHEVVIQGLQYVPQVLTVRRGDVIVWTNKDPFPHTVTAPGAFDSQLDRCRRLVAIHGANARAATSTSARCTRT